MMAGIDMIHVPYRGGGQVMTDLIAGQVQVSFIGLTVAIEYIRSGKVRALAVTTATRSDVLPDIPTVADFVPGYEASAFWGVGAPRNTPAEIVDKLNKEINAGLSDPKLRGRLAEGGGTVLAGSPADFGKFIGDETEKWAKVIKFAGISFGVGDSRRAMCRRRHLQCSKPHRYSSTSSAATSSVCGISRPSALAVLRLGARARTWRTARPAGRPASRP